MMKMEDSVCYVIAREGITGGTGSLSYRLICSMKEKGLNCLYFCCVNNDADNMTLFKNHGIEVICKKDRSYKEHFRVVQDRYTSFRFLVYSPEEYLAIERLSSCYSNIEGCIYYVVHDYAFCRPDSSRLFQLLSKCRYRLFVEKLCKNDAIIFMSRACLKNACDLMSFQQTKGMGLVINLPMKIKSLGETKMKQSKSRPFVISTITRMDFPFKGYVLGLIDWFSHNLEKYDLNLIIVGDGECSNELLSCMDKLNESVRSKITYIKSVPYNKLYTIFEKSDLYMGMGTTLIDAANEHTLAIPVKPYTKELRVDGLFSDNMDMLFAENGNGEFDQIFDRLYNSNEDDFFDLIRRQYLQLKSSYSMERMISFITHSIYKKKIISKTHICYMEGISKLSSLFH